MEPPFWTPPFQNRNKCAPLDYSLYTEELNCLGKPNGIKPRCYREHLGECILELGNILGTRGKNPKIPSRPPYPQKKKKRAPPEPSHWMHEFSVSKTVLSPFSA